ncbi:MAG: DUF3187 family protein [Desulfuromonadales bacterium]|nr:DUF3187 family protein [Desulfuromonadales bacterium]
MHRTLLTLLLLLPAAPLAALEITPFRVTNQTPLVQIFGLPPAAGGQTLETGRSELLLAVDVASHFTNNSRGDESIVLDGETYRYTLALRRGLSSGLEVGVEIPWVAHSGGFLDGFIEGWHDFFGLPQGGRDRAPRDQLFFEYRENGAVELQRVDSADGLGDIRLTAAWPLRKRSPSSTAAALHASLKLPTGDSDRLLGSGSTDLALGVNADRTFPSSWGEFALYGGGGLLLLTDGDVLPDRQRNLVGFATAGGAWRPLSWLAFKLQLDGHTAFYDSDLTELGESLQLTVGGTLDWGDTSLDIGVGEDIVVDSAPDVLFHLALRSRF